MLHSVCVCFFLAFTPFLLLLHCLVLLYILVCVYPLWHGWYVGFWAHVFFLSSLLGLGTIQAKAFAPVACWAFVLSLFFMAVSLLAFNPTILLHRVCHGLALPLLLIAFAGLLASVLAVSAHWPNNSFLCAFSAHLPLIILHGFVGRYFCHVSPLGLPLYFLGFLGPFTFFLLPWVYCLIPWASLAHLLHLYLFITLVGLLLDSLGFLSPLITSLPLYLFITVMGLLTLIPATSTHWVYHFFFLGFLGPFTSSLPLIIPICLLLHSLGFLGPFTPLPFVTFIGLLAINFATSTHWACFLISLPFSLPFFPISHIVRLLLLLGLLSKMGINTTHHIFGITLI